MKYRIISLITILLILFSLNTYALSNCKPIEVTLSPSTDSVTRNKDFEYGVYLKSSEAQNVATFRLKVSFDNKRFQCSGIEVGDYTDISQFKYNIEQGLITIIYLSPNSPYIINQDDDSAMFSIKFKSLKDASIGQGKFDAQIDGIANDDVEPIDLDSISSDSIDIVPDPVYDCTLNSLELCEADISPEFSKDVTEYSANVPSSVDSVEVLASPTDENASVKVNRKTLGKIGSTTDIHITVTSADKKSKLVYTISVKRNEKIKDDTSSSSTSSDSSNSTSSKDSSSKSSKSSSEKSSKNSSKNSSTNSSRKNKSSNPISDYSADESQNKSINTDSNLDSNPQLVKNVNNKASDLLVKNNNLPAFSIGILSIVIPIIGYLFYIHKIKPKNK